MTNIKNSKFDVASMRFFGAANLLLVALGAYFWIGTVGGALSQFNRSANSAPYSVYIYWAMALVSFVFLSLLVISGIGLLQLNAKSVRTCAITLAAEVAYVFIFVILQLVFARPGHEAIDRSLMQVSGIGEMALSPHLRLCIPLLD